jgi:hypothetical protein
MVLKHALASRIGTDLVSTKSSTQHGPKFQHANCITSNSNHCGKHIHLEHKCTKDESVAGEPDTCSCTCECDSDDGVTCKEVAEKPACCTGHTAECRACRAGMTKEDYCSKRPYDCTTLDDSIVINGGCETTCTNTKTSVSSGTVLSCVAYQESDADAAGGQNWYGRKCNKSGWKTGKYCAKECAEAGAGYSGDNCCTTTTTNNQPVAKEGGENGWHKCMCADGSWYECKSKHGDGAQCCTRSKPALCADVTKGIAGITPAVAGGAKSDAIDLNGGVTWNTKEDGGPNGWHTCTCADGSTYECKSKFGDGAQCCTRSKPALCAAVEKTV